MTTIATADGQGGVLARDGFDLPWAFEPHHHQWRDTMARFVRDRVEPGASERHLRAEFDPDLVRDAAALGMCGLLVDEENGGSGADLRTLCLAIEELATADSSLAVTIHVQAICASLLQHLVRDRRPDLCRELLPAAAAGEAFISIGLTEPSGGSDAGNIATVARRDGGDWVIDGSKQFITNSGTPFSRYVILMAAVEQELPGRPRVSAFLVPLDAPGVTVGGTYPKAGWRSSDTHPLFFDQVRVPAEAEISEHGGGYRDVLEFLTWARLPIAAMSAGLTRGCLADTLRFVEQRTSFTKPLGAHQGVAFQVADIAARAATARTLTYDGAWKYDHGLPIRETAAIAKLMASEAAV